jgi:hypothetical protein
LNFPDDDAVLGETHFTLDWPIRDVTDQRRPKPHALRHADVGVLITVARFLRNDYLTMLVELCPELIEDARPLRAAGLPCLRHVVCQGDDVPRGVLAWEDFLAGGDPDSTSWSIAALDAVEAAVRVLEDGLVDEVRHGPDYSSRSISAAPAGQTAANSRDAAIPAGAAARALCLRRLGSCCARRDPCRLVGGGPNQLLRGPTRGGDALAADHPAFSIAG